MASSLNISDSDGPIDNTDVFGYIPDEYMPTIETSINSVWLAVNVMGFVAGILTFIVFIKQGFDVHVNITLFTLNISDFITILSSIYAGVRFLFNTHAPEILYPLFGNHWIRDASYTISTWTIAYITTERTLCVVFPFKMKGVMTKTKTIVILVLIWVTTIAAYMKVIVNTTIRKVWNPIHNVTQWAYIFTPEYQQANQDLNPYSVAVYIVTEIVVGTMTILMIRGLSKAGKFRKSASSGAKQQEESKTDNTLSARDQNLVKVVTALAIVFIICNTPALIMFSMLAWMPGFHWMTPLRNLIMVLWNLMRILASINSSINIFIYYNLSSRFRGILRGLFICGQKEG